MKTRTILAALALAAASSVHAQQAQPPQDEVTEVEGLEARGAASARLPVTTKEYEAMSKTDWTVPHYSVEQMASFVCDIRKGGGAGTRLDNATIALRATEDFELVKLKVREGKGTMQDLVLANNRRQDAVEALLTNVRSEARAAMTSARTGRVMFKGRAPGVSGRLQDTYRINPQPPNVGDLWIDAYSFRVGNGKLGQTLIVTVDFVNKGTKNLSAGEINISALDRAKFILAQQSFKVAGGTLKPGQRGRAEFEFPNMPFYTHDIAVQWGEAWLVRNDRNCTVMEKFRVPGALLGLADEDEVQERLNDSAGLLPTLTVESLSAEKLVEGDQTVVVVTAALRNRLGKEQSVPNSTLVLLDDAGAQVGKAKLALSGIVIPANTTQMVSFKVRQFEPMTTADASPTAQMKDASLLVGKLD